MSDDIGLFSHKKFALQYAFRHKLFGGMLGAGIHLGLLSENFDGSKVDTDTPDDPAFPHQRSPGRGLTSVPVSTILIGTGMPACLSCTSTA